LYSLGKGVFQLWFSSYCLYADDGLSYDGYGSTIIINGIDSSVVQGPLNGELIRVDSPKNLVLPITASLNINLTHCPGGDIETEIYN
jgi:hypothetical protein